MKNRNTMPILRLAYLALFLIALVAVFTLWSQVGGQDHMDLISWYWKLGLGVGAAFAITQGAAAAVSGARAWNPRSVKWLLVALALLAGCGLASWYAHLHYEDDNQDDEGGAATPAVAVTRGYEWDRAFSLPPGFCQAGRVFARVRAVSARPDGATPAHHSLSCDKPR
jgi:hypothetical protein